MRSLRRLMHPLSLPHARPPIRRCVDQQLVLEHLLVTEVDQRSAGTRATN
jgi:hypothetical protein